VSELTVLAGQIVALRLFDVAYAIDLKRAEAAWTGHAAGRTSRPRLSATPPKAMAFGVPPLEITLDPVTLDLGAGPVELMVTARLYEFGAVSLALRQPVAGRAWSEYVRLALALDRAVASAPWPRLLDHVRGVLAAALLRPAASALEEDYLFAVVQAFDTHLDAAALLLPRTYDLVESARRGLNLLAARRYAGLARRLYTLVAEVTELTEKVDNALPVTEDVYLARVYAAALGVFRVRTVSAAVDRNLSLIRDTYTALYDEASSSRAELLEVAIVLLIVVELALALLRR
jgi:hypothetical protein